MKTYMTLSILFFLTVFCSNTFAQKTPEELGQATFYCFHQKNLDSFFKLIPSVSEILEFGRTLDIDSNSIEFKEFLSRYPLVIKRFKENCYELLTDSSNLNFSWTKARLEKVEKSEKTLLLDNTNANTKSVVLTIVDIYFISNDKKLKVTLGDANKYKGIWKPGNNIALSLQ
jgi:hypothetical protein